MKLKLIIKISTIDVFRMKIKDTVNKSTSIESRKQARRFIDPSDNSRNIKNIVSQSMSKERTEQIQNDLSTLKKNFLIMHKYERQKNGYKITK